LIDASNHTKVLSFDGSASFLMDIKNKQSDGFAVGGQRFKMVWIFNRKIAFDFLRKSLYHRLIELQDE
jgi:hypothetical protein